MIVTCGTCNVEMEHLGTFKTTVHRGPSAHFESSDFGADIFRCRNCLRIVVWET